MCDTLTLHPTDKNNTQYCFKILPLVGGVIFILSVIFAIWVRSIPPAIRDDAAGDASSSSPPPPPPGDTSL